MKGKGYLEHLQPIIDKWFPIIARLHLAIKHLKLKIKNQLGVLCPSLRFTPSPRPHVGFPWLHPLYQVFIPFRIFAFKAMNIIY